MGIAFADVVRIAEDWLFGAFASVTLSSPEPVVIRSSLMLLKVNVNSDGGSDGLSSALLCSVTKPP